MSKKITKSADRRTVRMLDDKTPFAIKEAYNQLRTNLLYTAKDASKCPIYAVTSAEAGDGKSTVISNLAISFAQVGKKVLLIDADMRRPVQYQNFKINKKQTGLSELLSGIAQYDQSVFSTPVPSLFVLTSGCIPPNPSELMLGSKFEELAEKWKNEFDVIFIDLPPVGVVSDPLSVAAFVDGYVLVVMANKTDARHLNAAIETLKQIDAKVLGTVIAGSNLKGNGSYKYSNKYGYNYASSFGSSDN